MNHPAHKPKITVCVATYNQRAYIRDCLSSVLMQDCPADLEIIVGDDCSTDEAPAIISEIAETHPGRIMVPRRNGNLGASENYKDMIRSASGDYIAHIDGDDYWMPGKLAAQLAYLQSNPSCVAVYSNAHIVDDAGQLIGAFNNVQPETFDTDYLLNRGNFLNHSSMLYRAEFRDCILGLPDSFIDYRMHLRLSLQGELGYINKDLAAYRSGTSTSMIKHIPHKVNDLYWEAITDPEIAVTFKKSSLSAQSLFFAHILYNAMRRNRLAYAQHWASRIQSEHRDRFRVILARSVFLLFPIFWRSTRRKVAGILSGYEFYPRYER
jgi:glycosyltransferase involved in cell wall biosynthesis